MMQIKSVKKNIILVWKPVGLTPLETIRLLQKEHPEYKHEKIGYAGRLDPMAEGWLLLLIGDENRNRKKYEKLDKTYEFEVLFGVSTDSYDLLGIVAETSPFTNLTAIRTNLAKALPHFTGTINQTYPPYSAARIQGKPLYWWARNKRLGDITLPAHPVTIYDLRIKSIRQRAVKYDDVVEKITRVRGDFRQKEIIASWQKFFGNKKSIRLPVAALVCRCSAGTYIRQLVSDISLSSGMITATYMIIRTHIIK